MMGLQQIKQQPFGGMILPSQSKENDIHVKVALFHDYPHRTHLFETIALFTSKGMRYRERERDREKKKQTNEKSQKILCSVPWESGVNSTFLQVDIRKQQSVLLHIHVCIHPAVAWKIEMKIQTKLNSIENETRWDWSQFFFSDSLYAVFGRARLRRQ